MVSHLRKMTLLSCDNVMRTRVWCALSPLFPLFTQRLGLIEAAPIHRPLENTPGSLRFGP